MHGTYGVEEAFAGGQGGIVEPIFPSTSQAYRDSDEMEAGLGYLIPTWCYSRIHNPTVFYLEETLALLESYGCAGDASCLCTSSGMAAIKQAVEPLLALSGAPGEAVNFVSAAQVYGGTFQLFNLRMRERGAQVRWVTEPWEIGAWRDLVDENTRFLYAEMPSNPQQACFDVAAVAELAHDHGIPLIVDATIATPALMRPLAHGADVVVHSLTKTVGAGGLRGRRRGDRPPRPHQPAPRRGGEGRLRHLAEAVAVPRLGAVHGAALGVLPPQRAAHAAAEGRAHVRQHRSRWRASSRGTRRWRGWTTSGCRTTRCTRSQRGT